MVKVNLVEQVINIEANTKVKKKATKQMISIRMDTDILDWFKAKSAEIPGGSYQRMLNNVARAYMDDNMK